MPDAATSAARRTGLGLALGTALLVVGWHAWVVASRHRVLALAARIGSVPQFRERLHASPDGSSLVFYRETEHGLGAWLCTADTGGAHWLFDQPESGFNGYLGSVAWSPDSRWLACTWKNADEPEHPKREIGIFDAASGRTALRLDALWDSRVIWLSNTAFAYTRYNGAWLVWERPPDGVWRQTLVANRFGRDPYLYNLIAAGPRRLAWEQEDEIWTHDLGTGAEMKVWPLAGAAAVTVYRFSYDAGPGEFLLEAGDAAGPMTIRVRPPVLDWGLAAVVTTNRDEPSPPHVDLALASGHYTFTVRDGGQTPPFRLDYDGMVEDYQLAGHSLYFAGNPAAETPGIWQYDLTTKELRRLTAQPANSLPAAQTILPTVGLATTTSGRKISYHLWRPPHPAAGKKYPLILGQTHYIWNPCQQIAPAAGYYFATVDRATWADNIDNWPEDVLALYTILAQNPHIDPRRVFLTAFSAEANDVNQLLATRPGLCRGVALFNPAAAPDLSRNQLASLWIAGGRDDGNSAAALSRYQAEAAKIGLPVELLLQAGAQHVVRSVATERERSRRFAEFLLEN